MNILTRGDFDGLVSSLLLSEAEQPISEIKFCHPKDAQDGKVSVSSEDIVVNIPYIPGCGMWFDHHVSESTAFQDFSFKGRFEVAPSCARVVYNYYPSYQSSWDKKYFSLLDTVDRLDSGQLTLADIVNPIGWMLLGLTIDPRSGLGLEFRKYFLWLLTELKTQSLEDILSSPSVAQRISLFQQEQEKATSILKSHSSLNSNVIVVDLRDFKEKVIGNRFLIYTIYPEANVEVRAFPGMVGSTVIAVGHSVINRSCSVNVGDLLKRYGGGGHFGAGTCQVPSDLADFTISEIVSSLKGK